MAVVTGGASGIGAAIAARLTADGYRVAVFDVAQDGGPHCFVVDVTDRAQVEAAVGEVRSGVGPIGILVNAAGAEGNKSFLKITFEEWKRVVDVNLNGVFHCTQAVLPDMIAGQWGRIINISSSSTHSGTSRKSHYVASKTAVNGLSKALAVEYGPHGITVNAVAPGFIDTPMLRNSAARGDFGRYRIEDFIAMTPVRRIGSPHDIAGTCAFLASDQAGFITGQIVGVNGGRNT